MEPTAKRVLVVDDDPATRDFVRQCLTAQGVEVAEAAMEDEAFERLAQRRPDLICLDLMLPDSSGIDFCEKLAAIPELRDVPVLIISARRLPQDRALAMSMGAAGYLTKPLNAESLISRVASLLALDRRVEAKLPMTAAR